MKNALINFFHVFLFRMESIYSFLLHEQSLIQGDHKDGNLLSSIEYHRRDLETALETAKWQVFLVKLGLTMSL